MSTPHYLLGLRAGWREMTLTGVTLAGDPPRLRLASVPAQGRPLVDEGGSFGGLTLPVGVAVAPDDSVYALDAGHTVKRFDPCTCSFSMLDCIGGEGGEPRQLRDARALAISCAGDLYIADTGNRRIQVFALKGLALRAVRGPYRAGMTAGKAVLDAVAWRAGDAEPPGLWKPVDVAIGPSGRLYVCDNANNAIHVFSPQGRQLRTIAGPPNAPLAQPLRIAVDGEERLYVIEANQAAVRVFGPDGALLSTVTGIAPVEHQFCPTSVAVDAAGNMLLGDRYARLVRVHRPTQAELCDCVPVSATLESCGDLAFDRHGNPFACDPARGCVVQFAGQSAFATDGVYTSAALDSETYQCVWHRIAIDASVPAGTRIEVRTFASEALLSQAEIDALPDAAWSTRAVHADTSLECWDALALAAPGRYLWLRLLLSGSGSATPVVRSVAVEFPRRTSLDYLPAVYREDAASADFLARFLSIFDTGRARTSALLEAWPGYLDPRAAPAPEFLEWLAGWLGIALDRHWPLAKQRELVRMAHRLYELRGTCEGLALHLQIYTGRKPRILEHYRLRQWLYVGHATLGDSSRLYGQEIVRRLQLDEFSRIGDFELLDTGDPVHDPFDAYAHRFTVFVALPRDASDLFRHTVERIVEQAKPAHTQAQIAYVEPRLRIGAQSWMGLDTVIGAYPENATAGGSRVGCDTVVSAGAQQQGAPTLRVGSTSRVGTSTLID